MKPGWFSQPVPPLGAIKAAGIKNQLGRPDLDPLTVLVREAAQNSWDARDPGRQGAVHFCMAADRMTGAQASAWRERLSVGLPPAESLDLGRCLEEEELEVLFVGDRGTGGLGGPTRADDAGAERHDYVSFVLNVGDPRDVEGGGGTYGFGKAVFYLASEASTVLIHTRCRTETGEIQTRLVGCALGRVFQSDGQQFTGRHWFGFDVNGEWFEPVEGDEADVIAAELGFPGFAEGELGTTVAVIAPRFDGRTADEACRFVADSILWHLWPKMHTRSGQRPSMTFSVSRNGAETVVAKPGEHPVVREFAAALDALGTEGDLITYGRNAEPVGRLWLRTPFTPPTAVGGAGVEIGLDQGVHHCCLLRVPELVVGYRPGPPPIDERAWYAGVFRVLDEPAEIEEIFAASEPPTHDAWVAKNLESKPKSVVQTTLRKIDEAMRSHAAPAVVPTEDEGHVGGLAGASRMLGSLLSPTPGTGAGPRRGSGGGGSNRSVIRMVGQPAWEEHDGRWLLAQRFEVNAQKALAADAQLRVRLWGGGAAADWDVKPELSGWRGPDGTMTAPGRLALEAGASGVWTALVQAPSDTVVSIRVQEAKGRPDA